MTLALVTLASILLQISLIGRQAVVWPGRGQLAVAALIAALASRWNRRSPWAYAWSFGALVLLSLAWDATTRALLGYGDPYEVKLAYTLRNLMLGLAASRSEMRTQRFAVLASFFLVLFSFLWSMNLVTVLLLVAYALVGMWWLLGSYWEGIQGRLADKTEQAIPVQPALVAIGVVLLLVLAALPIARSQRVATALQGFFPSSGGSQWADDFAHGGVGDGNQMIAAKEDASSFGAVESELFLESKMPSLYDVFNERSEPSKKNEKRGRQRAIPLAPTTMQQNHEKLGQNKQTNREFDTIRTRSKRKKKNLNNHDSPALLQIRGRAPVHLGLYTYNTWDGRSLSWSGVDEKIAKKLDKDSPDGRVWLRLALFFPEPLFNYTERHQVRIINLETQRIPSPPNLTAINVDYLHDVDMFRHEDDGFLALSGAVIPQLTVLNVESRRLSRYAEPPLPTTKIPSSTSRVAELAKAWTTGVEPGWPQVVAIRNRLREEYLLDDDSVVPADCDDSVEHFLFDAKRGPDYLFATSAALLLRSLGYEARVTSGFYARPGNYNRLADLTPIYPDDAHFWLEVYSTSGMTFDKLGERRFGSWIPVDPSPGYEVLYTPDTLFTRWANSITRVMRAISTHPLQTTLATAVLAALGWFRVPLLDRFITAWWGVAYRVGDARQQVLATVQLLERRAWLQSRPRGNGTTIGRWQLHGPEVSPESASAIKDFQRIASWALYSDDTPTAVPAERIRTSCRETARLALRNP